VVEEVLSEFKNDVETATLVPSSGGIFEVKAGNTLVFSKAEAGGRFPEPGEVLERVKRDLA
jgi:selenoprotein W-related protein